jgi:tetratricopeptide (TPR) repeat protein
MSTRLLERIDRELAAAGDAATRARLLQDRAVALTRLARNDESHEALAAARREPQQALPEWLGLRFGYVAAIQTYFARRFAEATAQMREVLARAREIGNAALVAECESALAIFLQRDGDVRGAARHARAVLAGAEAGAESRYRAALALGSLLQDANEFDEAARLFAQARAAVDEMGDDVAMASLLHRTACLQAAQVRQAAARGTLDPTAVRRAIGGLQTSIEFGEQAGEAPARVLDELMLAEMLMLQERYAEALALYEANLERAERDGRLVEVTVALADRALCLLKIGHADAALAAARAAQARLDDATPAEIRAIVHGNLASVLGELGDAGQAREHAALARIAWDAAAHEQREARRLLAEAAATEDWR